MSSICSSSSQQKQQKGKRVLEAEVEEPKDARVKGTNINSTPTTATATEAQAEAQPQKKQKTNKTNPPYPSFVVTLSQTQIDALQSAVNNLAQTFSTVFAAPGLHQTPASPSSTSAEATKKKIKDPNAPHRAPTGYNLFAQEKGKSIRLNDSSVDAKDVMRATGLAWKALSDEERAEWNAQALPAQKEYTSRKASYVALHKDDPAPVASSGNTKVKRNKRDPNLPKLPVNAYTRFTTEHYPVVKESHPEIPSKDRLKEVAKKWATLSEKEKKRYEADAEKDKQRYIAEMIAAGHAVKISSSNTISSTKKQTLITTPTAQQHEKDEGEDEDDNDADDDDENSSKAGDESESEEQEEEEEEEEEEEPSKPVVISKKQKKQESAPATAPFSVQTRAKKTTVSAGVPSSTSLKKTPITQVLPAASLTVAPSTPESKKNKKLLAAAEISSSARQVEFGETIATSGRKTKLVTKVELVKKKKEKKASLSGSTNE
ncbi:hypothetical protein HK100_011496 [Physocladia obscura]|uniref:HMG box domain-containing protein n=1 Tax=Physocladia obscura TaxID=109957 RepID=A0AAD5XGX7_9FUNG|nr:hypothetical protein HK100_011496 [Physocladia obscura]